MSVGERETVPLFPSHLDFSGATPAALFSWPHETTSAALDRNVEGLKICGEILAPVLAIAQPYAEKAGLHIDWNDPSATTSKLATITQSPREFDFTNPGQPPTFHYAGPFHDDEGRQEIPFPWEMLTNKPLVYASLGTIVNGLDHVYRVILEAVGKFPEIQTVLSVGKNINPDVLGQIPPNTIVVSEAPQIELLKRATLCITHAGLNTTLESLAQGVPMVAIPIGHDQPGVAARIAHHGVGEFVEVGDLTADRLLELIQRVATDQDYRVRARYFRDVIAKTRGLDVAAEIIEQSLGSKSNFRSSRKTCRVIACLKELCFIPHNNRPGPAPRLGQRQHTLPLPIFTCRRTDVPASEDIGRTTEGI
jgi:zeaxanthin glucosyltransferase